MSVFMGVVIAETQREVYKDVTSGRKGSTLSLNFQGKFDR